YERPAAGHHRRCPRYFLGPPQARPTRRAGCGLAGPLTRFRLGWRYTQPRRRHRGLRPPPARHDRRLPEQHDGSRVVVPRSRLDDAVREHPFDDLATCVSTHQGERPVVERADTTRGDVRMLGGEIRAELATLARPPVALLERHFVVAAVVHPDLEHALDVHLLDVRPLEAVLGLQKFLENRVIEGLRAEQPDRESEPPARLAGLARSHYAGDGSLAAHPDQSQALGS